MTNINVTPSEYPRIASGRFADVIDRHPTRIATLASWGYQAVNVVAMMVFAPAVLARFGAETTGIWFFLLGCVTFFQLCDFGLAMSVSRQIAYSLTSSGSAGLPEGNTFIAIHGARASHEVFLTARRLFSRIAWLILVLAIIVERTVLFRGHMAANVEARLTWYLVVVAGLGYFLTRPYQVYLEGLFLQAWERLMVYFVTIAGNVALLLAVWYWHRLWVIGGAFALGGWLQYVCTVYLARRAVPAEVWTEHTATPGLARLLWRASWEQGVTSIAVYLVMSANPMLIGWLMGPIGVSEYYLPWRAVTAAQAAVIAIFLPHLPFMIERVGRGEHAEVRRRFRRLLAVGMAISLTGYGAFVLVGPQLFLWWLHDSIPVSRSVLGGLAIWQLLGVVQTICWLYVVAYGVQRFAHAVVAGAILNVVLSIWMIPRWGVLGSVVATTLAQLLTSNWYLAWRAWRLMRAVAPAPATEREGRQFVAAIVDGSLS